ncbi:hypothetical protein OTU49_010042 [Cherax quadricarinatus]|uniref:C2H2-type domain-containing protein n=2 Tax=Cherax quadricarinatus TaxID=27406 RepID=A0AAW0WHP6_CHEQU|nr:uncharacterized protein LOC128701590 [Cherax quadricarinatus]
MEPIICYICNDKRRIADTDTSETRITNSSNAETLKEILIRALSLGYVEDNSDNSTERDQGKFSSGICIVSLNSRYDGGLEAVSERVLCDSVIICRRCESLLRDFEYHERTSAKIAEEIRKFLTRQGVNEKEEINIEKNGEGGHSVIPKAAFSTSVIKHLDERQGILAAFRALRKSGVTGAKKRGRKRKNELVSTSVINESGEDEVGEDIEKAFAKEIANEKKRLHSLASSRSSKRIQRRREDGLVVKWGDAMYETENSSLEPNVDADDIFDDDSETWSKQDSQPRKKRGRKPSQHHLIRFTKPAGNNLTHQSQDQSDLKYQCPFCYRYYIPSNSRIHNCTSYKNQLRCHLCNIFFTSYVRLEKHLEVIHLKQKQVKCQEKNCQFMCISEPAFVLHKHFHFLAAFKVDGNEEETYLEDNITELDREHHRVTHALDPGDGEVTIIDDIQGILTSPDIADQVSFLLDEKSFLTDGQPINITTDKASTKAVKDQRNILYIESSMREDGKTEQGKAKLFKQEIIPNKSDSVYKIVRREIQCPFCDMRFESQKTFQVHMKEIHIMLFKAKSDRSIGNKIENAKDTVINKVCRVNVNVKKNFNITPEDLTYTVERLKGKLSKP